ncbi:MAG: YqiJ family protein [Pseudomonadota bacterium]
MFDAIFSPATTPFAVAIGLMLLIALLEIVGALMGTPASAVVDSFLPEVDADIDVDLDVDVDADFAGGPFDADAPAVPDAPNAGPLSQVLGWLCIGKVPILVILVVFLTAFGMTGYLVQGLMRAGFGFPLPAWIAVVPAFAAALPVTRMAGLGLAKIVPKEQTEAVSKRDFIGRIATITLGQARRDLPAEAKLTDSYGRTHYVRVEPDADGDVFDQGSDVILVKQVGGIFLAIPNRNAALKDASDLGPAA